VDTVLRIRTAACMHTMHTRQSPYEIIGNCSDKGGKTLNRWNVYSARGIGSQACDVCVSMRRYFK